MVRDASDLMIAPALFVFLCPLTKTAVMYNKARKSFLSLFFKKKPFSPQNHSLPQHDWFPNGLLGLGWIDGWWSEMMQRMWQVICHTCTLLSQLIVYNLSLQGSQLILNGHNSVYSSRRPLLAGRNRKCNLIHSHGCASGTLSPFLPLILPQGPCPL